MDTQQTTPVEVTHLSRERLHELSAAYGDTDKVLVARALAVFAALGDGVDVKTMAADLADAHRADPNINPVSERYLGLAKFATTAADIIGTDLRAWAKRSPAEVAYVIRTAKRVGLNAAGKAIRDAVKPIDTSKVAERQEVAMTALEAKRAEVLAPKAPSKPRQSKQSDPADGPAFIAELTGPEALAAVRNVTAYLTGGGAYTADLASAVAELTAAMTAARKRGAAAAARTAGTSVETVAA
jgi:hypothetical protein